MLGNQHDRTMQEPADKFRISTGHVAKRKKYNQTTHGGPQHQGSGLLQEGAPSDKLSHKQLTNWQKISINNHELTKLFYQLPAGTKNLVQHAILSQNKQLLDQHQMAKNQANATKTFQGKPRKVVLPEPQLTSAKAMSSSKAELISHGDYFPMLNETQGKASSLAKPMTASKNGRILKSKPAEQQLTFE